MKMLPFSTESNIIKSIIHRQNRQITFQKMVAKRRKFDRMIVLNPRILHLCVHSRSDRETQRLNANPWVLLFEKDAGESDPVDKSKIDELFKCETQ